MLTEDPSKNEIHYVEHLDRQMRTWWIEDQEQSWRSFMLHVDKPRVVKLAWERDEDFIIQWRAKQDSESGKSDVSQKKNKHKDRNHL